MRLRLKQDWVFVRQYQHCGYALQTHWINGRGAWRIVEIATGEVVRQRGGYRHRPSVALKGRAALKAFCQKGKRR
jgi:hypothetical protein